MWLYTFEQTGELILWRKKLKRGSSRMRALSQMFGIAMLSFSLSASSDVGRDPYKHFFELSFGDFTEELARVKDEGKKALLIFFESDDCPFCHRMKDTVLNQEKVQAYFKKHFLSFSVDVEGDTEVVSFQGKNMKAKDFAFKENRVRATPVFAFYNQKGKRISRYIGATSGIDEFLLLGRYVAEGHYNSMPFTKYKRQQKTSPQ